MAKRINRKFLRNLTVVLVVAVGVLGAALVLWRMRKRDPKPFLDRANQYVANYLQQVPQYLRGTWVYDLPAAQGPTTQSSANGDEQSEVVKGLEEAVIELNRAAQAARNDPKILIAMGDVRRLLTRHDRKLIGADVATWEAVLEIDPSYLPALHRLLDAVIEYTEVFAADSGGYTRLGQKAEALAKADPKDVRAQAYQQIAVIGGWLAGKAMPAAAIEERLKALGELQKGAPGLVDIPRYLARANLRLAQDRAAEGDIAGAKRLIQRAMDAFAKAPEQSQNDPRFLQQQSQVLGIVADSFADELAKSDQFFATDPSGPSAGEAEAKIRSELERQSATCLERAAKLVSQTAESSGIYDRTCSEILTGWARYLSRQDRSDEAKQILDRLLEKRPADMVVALAAADFYKGKQQYEEAVKLLSKAAADEGGEADDPELVGFRAAIKPQLAINALVERAHLRLNAYALAKTKGGDEEALNQQRAQVEKDYDRAAAMVSAELPRLLKLKGKMLLIFGGGDERAVRDAIPVLQKAYDKLMAQRMFDYEVASLLERAYRAARENGQAMAILSRIVGRYPMLVQERKQLVMLQLREGQYVQADAHIQELEKQQPQDPEILGYRLAVIGAREQELASPAVANVEARNLERAKAELAARREAVLKRVQSLPEEQPQQRLSKAQVLIGGKQLEAAKKLLLPMVEEEIKDDAKPFPAATLLYVGYMSEGKQQEAQQLVARVLAKDPENVGWKSFAVQAKGTLTPDEQRKIAEELAAGIKDEAERAMERARLILRQNKDQIEQALAVLREAEQKAPQNTRLLEFIWECLFTRQQWDQVEKYTQKLSDLNADQVQGLTYKARVKLERNDVEGALRDAIEVSRQLPHFARTWVLLGQAQQRSMDLQSAINSYTEALNRQPDNMQALNGLASCHLALGQTARAKEYIQRGMRLEGPSGRFAEIARLVDERSGDLQALMAATTQREKELEANREDIARWLALANNYGSLVQRLRKTDPKASDNYLNKATALMAEALKKFPDEAEPYRRQAQHLLLAGKPEEGVKLYEQLKSREAWKDRAEPSILLASYLERLGEDALAAAEQAWLEAVSKSKNSVEVQRELARFYGRTGQHDKAINRLTSLVQQTQDSMLRNQLVEVQVIAGKLADAEKVLGEVLKEKPADVVSLTQLGVVKMAQGDYKAAEDCLQQARRADPDYIPARIQLGQMKINRGDLAEAITELQAACDLRPSNAGLRAVLADAYRRRNQMDKAAEEMETAVRLEPTNQGLRQTLIRYYLSEQRWVQAQRLLDDAKANPELADNPIWYRLESAMWQERGNLQQAFDALLPAGKLAPKDPGILKDTWDVLLKAGGNEEVIRFTNEYVRQLQSEVQRQQDAGQQVALAVPWWVHMQRGLARKGLGNVEQAFQEFQSGLSAIDRIEDDSNAEVLVNSMVGAVGHEKTVEALSARAKPRWKIALVTLYAARADWNNAVRVLDELIERDLESLNYFQKMTVLRKGGPIYHQASATITPAAGKAEQVYNRYLKELEDQRLEVSLQLETLNNLALLLAEHPVAPNLEKAKIYSAKAMDLVTKANAVNPGVLDTYGWVLVLSGRVDEGIEPLRKAANLGSPDACYHMGEAYMKKSEPDAARRSYTQAKDLLGKLKAEKRFVDPGLEAKVDAALKKLGETAPSGR